MLWCIFMGVWPYYNDCKSMWSRKQARLVVREPPFLTTWNDAGVSNKPRCARTLLAKEQWKLPWCVRSLPSIDATCHLHCPKSCQSSFPQKNGYQEFASKVITKLVTQAIGPNKSKKLTWLITPAHNICDKVWMKNNIQCLWSHVCCFSFKLCRVYCVSVL